MTGVMEALKHKPSVAPIPSVRPVLSNVAPTRAFRCSCVLGLRLTSQQVVPGNTPIYQEAGDVGNRTLW